ncbi:MAG: transposase domain-containing protein [Magnetococcales bacterium]|nr:transposase domain-containing protein [Magnetococcales bacterium]
MGHIEGCELPEAWYTCLLEHGLSEQSVYQWRKRVQSNGDLSVAPAAPMFQRLIETAKANGLEPVAYLQHVFERIPTAQTLKEYESLLPWKLTREMQPKVSPSD